MATKVIRVDARTGFADAVREAASALDAGALVAFPTETVYGLAARADLPDAIARLREVKQRDSQKAFTVHVGTPRDALQYVADPPGVARRFMAKAWPGPLTLIFPVSDTAAALGKAKLDPSTGENIYYDNTIGLRCPDDPVTLAILRAVGGPVVASSANKPGDSPPVTGEDVLRDLDSRIDLLVDAGATKYAKPSTVVRITDAGYDLVREGVYDKRIVERLAALGILFVCTGNTCRSVMAEAQARKMLAKRAGCAIDELSARGIHVDSAGTSGGYGSATDHVVTVMRSLRLDVTDHRSRALTRDMVRQADYLLAMTTAHRTRIIELEPSAADRTALLIEGEDIRDPIGQSVEEYRRCAKTIERGLQTRLAEITL